MPFDMGKLKKFYGIALKIAIIVTLVWGILGLVGYMTTTGKWNPFGWSGFIMFIMFIILEYVGYLMLTGKFQPPQEMQQGQPIFKQQPQRHQRPIQPRRQQPIEINYDVCAFCGEEKPVHELTPFRSPRGDTILVCEDCLDEESG